MVEWLGPVLGLLIVGTLLWIGVRITRYKHEAMVLLCLGEVFRIKGEPDRARRFYDAAKAGKVKLPEADEALHALDEGSVDPVVDHPLVEDLERRLRDERDELSEWLAERGFPSL